MLRLHDTLSGEKVELRPGHPGRISIYVCGPTVYDVPHLGHARSVLVFDVIRRYLEWSGHEVAHVSNVTDVEDKIIARAAQEGSTEPEVAQRYEAVYVDQMARLGALPSRHVPHATEYIDEMLGLIGELVDTGHGYVAEGRGVYFSVESYPHYGWLAHRTIEQLRESAGARLEVDEAKRSPLDFALWKAAKPGEPRWDSPWGPGRPGWHIECSAMSLDLLGEGFDIHGAGSDLVFPHNENERVQAEAAGHPFARYWIHHGMVELAGEKMSKSLGNFVTLAEALDEHDPRALRMAVLQTHYRSDIELGRAELEAAEEAVRGLDALARRARVAGIDLDGEHDEERARAFSEAMDDDFATPEAMAVVFDATAEANRAIDAADKTAAGRLVGSVVALAGALGLVLRGEAEADAGIDAQVAERDAARQRGDYDSADRIKAQLESQGVTLEDTPEGTIWYR